VTPDEIVNISAAILPFLFYYAISSNRLLYKILIVITFLLCDW